MFLIRFKEFDFELVSVKELFFIREHSLALQVASELNEFLQDSLIECRNKGIVGCVEIPELEIFIVQTSSVCVIEAIEIKPFTPLNGLTYKHLLALT